MNILGVDVAKDSLVAVLCDRSGKIKKTYTVFNTKEDIEGLIDEIYKKHNHLSVASEATGEYHLELAKCCVLKDIPFRLLNPITTKQFTRATVRKKKTDLSDAHVIAMLAARGEGTVIDASSFSHLKPIVRTATKLAQVKQQLDLMSKRLKAINLDEKLQLEICACVDKLDLTIKVFRSQALAAANAKDIKLLTSIPGIGKTLAVTISAEVENVRRFKDGDSLVAYCGLDPRVKQSGASLHHNTKITKRGSPYLRRAFFMAGFIAGIHDPELKAYYQKKRGEGKYFREATVAVARKLVYRVYAVLKRQTVYVK